MNKLQIFINKIEAFLAKAAKKRDGYVSKEKLIKRFNFNYIGSGISRRVFTHNDFKGIVFKIQGRGDKTCSPNYSEWSAYRKATPKQQEVLAKPIAISKNYRVLVMENAAHKKVLFKTIVPFIKKMRKVLPPHLKWDVQERHLPFYANIETYSIQPHNIGVCPNGQFKVFDYASCATT